MLFRVSLEGECLSFYFKYHLVVSANLFSPLSFEWWPSVESVFRRIHTKKEQKQSKI